MPDEKNIIRTDKKAHPFAMIDHRMLNDEGLSWQAKGLLSYLLSKPDDWNVVIADLINKSTNGRDSVKNILNELEERGYIERKRTRDEASGQFLRSKTIVREWINRNDTTSYKKYLKSDHWKRVRKRTLKIDGYRCRLCNSNKSLNVHHRTYENIGAEKKTDVITLCRACHEKFHDKVSAGGGVND